MEESVEHRNLVVGYLKTVAANELAARMGKSEEFDVDHEDVLMLVAPLVGPDFNAATLLKNAKAFQDNQSQFTGR